jgi:hypothetical protein
MLSPCGWGVSDSGPVDLGFPPGERVNKADRVLNKPRDWLASGDLSWSGMMGDLAVVYSQGRVDEMGERRKRRGC